MTDPDMNDLVLKKLNEFESLESIRPSAGWNESLVKKLDSARAHSISAHSFSGFTFAVILAVLINLGFILNSIIHNSDKSLYKDKEFQVISEELLINPISYKN